ncbi:MAG: NAD(P)-dependent oxidoreductase [Bacillaceae bacterium]|nr:NAD(P)-dependent oxidoreductase [Bacillaceae bacterium]
MKILMTGSTGYVGSNLVFRLLKTSHQLGLIVRDRHKAIQMFGRQKEVTLIDQNINDFAKKVKEFNPEVVVHLAAYSTSSDDRPRMQMLINSNILYSTEILNCLKDTDVRLFINTGTFAQFYYNDGDFNSAYLYAATKTAFLSLLDYYQKLIGFNVVNVIPYTIYGEHDTRKKVFHYIIDSLNSPTPIGMTAGEQILDFIYINDVVDFYMRLLDRVEDLVSNAKSNSQLHLGSGHGTSIKQLTAYIEDITGERANIQWGARAYRKNDIMYAVAPITRNLELLDWRAKTNLKDGLRKMIEKDRDS